MNYTEIIKYIKEQELKMERDLIELKTCFFKLKLEQELDNKQETKKVKI